MGSVIIALICPGTPCLGDSFLPLPPVMLGAVVPHEVLALAPKAPKAHRPWEAPQERSHHHTAHHVFSWE